jgi:hypothetical protein
MNHLLDSPESPRSPREIKYGEYCGSTAINFKEIKDVEFKNKLSQYFNLDINTELSSLEINIGDICIVGDYLYIHSYDSFTRDVHVRSSEFFDKYKNDSSLFDYFKIEKLLEYQDYKIYRAHCIPGKYDRIDISVHNRMQERSDPYQWDDAKNDGKFILLIGEELFPDKNTKDEDDHNDKEEKNKKIEPKKWDDYFADKELIKVISELWNKISADPMPRYVHGYYDGHPTRDLPLFDFKYVSDSDDNDNNHDKRNNDNDNYQEVTDMTGLFD